MKYFKQIVHYVLPYKGVAVLNIVCNILSVIFELLALLLFIPFLTLIFNPDQVVLPTAEPKFEFSKHYFELYFNYLMGQYVNDENKVTALMFVCLLVGVLFFLKNLFRYLGMFFIAVIRNGVVRDIRNKVYDKIVELPLGYYSDEKKGDILSKITNDVQNIEWSILSSIEMIFREPIAILLSVGVLVTISPQLTLFSFILLPISGIVISRLGKSLKRSSRKVQDQMGHLLSYVEESLGGLRIIKAFNAQQHVSESFKKLNQNYYKLSLKMTRKRDLASPLSEFLGSVVMVIIAWYGGSLIFDGEIKLKGGEFIGYIIVFARLITPVKAFTTAYSEVQKGAASAQRVEEILKAENNIKEVKHPVSKTSFEDKIEYQNVSFKYTEKEYVLKNINLTIEKGKTVALVGESGGGKSTLADLLPRFYDVTEGELLIDGINVKELKINDLRNLMGIVTQESILFNDTVFNNIAFGNQNVSKEKVIEAAKIANAHAFIMELENGYDTNIGDRGGKLSGGQRQRISIARAILKNPPILILDEATSALDTESEKLVQEALFKLMENRTSIIIAHRLSTIKNADEIIVIQKGEIIERGTHNELLALNGVYKKLSDLQTFA
ncbi:MAG: ABC transporter ATP-binding protein [Vicingaceae bacterium]